MWVLVVYDPLTSEIEVRGPWNDPNEAVGAAEAYKERDERETPPLVTVAPIQPMVYFKPSIADLYWRESRGL